MDAEPGSPSWGGPPCGWASRADTPTAHPRKQCFARHPVLQKVTEGAATSTKPEGRRCFHFGGDMKGGGAGRGLAVTPRWVWPSHGRIRRGRKRGSRVPGRGAGRGGPAAAGGAAPGTRAAAGRTWRRPEGAAPVTGARAVRPLSLSPSPSGPVPGRSLRPLNSATPRPLPKGGEDTERREDGVPSAHVLLKYMEQRRHVHVATVLHVDARGAPPWTSLRSRGARLFHGHSAVPAPGQLPCPRVDCTAAEPSFGRVGGHGGAVLCPSYDSAVLTLPSVMWDPLAPCCPGPHPHARVCPCEEDVPCPGTVSGPSPVPRAAVALGLSSSLKPGPRRLKAGLPQAALCLKCWLLERLQDTQCAVRSGSGGRGRWSVLGAGVLRHLGRAPRAVMWQTKWGWMDRDAGVSMSPMGRHRGPPRDAGL